MKKRACVGFLVMSLYVTVSVAAAYAQSNMRLMAHVPFDFQVGGKILPAGEYDIRSFTSSEAALRISSENGRETLIVLSNHVDGNVNERGQARLVFHRYGDQYFLTTVWGPERAGRAILESRRERSLRKEMRIAERAGLAPEQMQIVTVVARYVAD